MTMSLTIAAVICTLAEAGRIAGAVYTPSGVIVPDVPLPPGMPFTLQLTAVSAVFATFAENDIAFPSITDPFFGEIVTVMDGGGGGGGTDALAPPPPQPIVHAPVASRTNRKSFAFRNLFRSNGERGGLPSREQAKGQRKSCFTIVARMSAGQSQPPL
jgi:hypothetical protein